jgi:hypothetical protein
MSSTTRPAPSTPADWYATAYARCSPAQIFSEHGGPETQKGGAHAPVKIRNTTGEGMATATGCMCGHRPKNWPTSPRSTEHAYKAHIRSLGLPRIWNVSHAVYAFGEGYPGEGLTFNEWHAFNPNENGFGPR